jgi:hypothetical protein
MQGGAAHGRDEITASFDHVAYFPSYELMTPAARMPRPVCCADLARPLRRKASST